MMLDNAFFFQHTAAPRPPAAVARELIVNVKAALRDAVASYIAWRETRAAIKQLMTFEDHRLDDIGLTRQDVQAEARKYGLF